MTTDLISRGLITLGLFGAGWLVPHLLKHFSLQRTLSKVRGLPGYSPGRPTVVYFTTPDCVACQVQKPVIARLQEKVQGPLQIVEIDAASHPDLARDWKVLSVPMTFILDSRGIPRYVNYGLTYTNQLYAQI